MKRCKHYVGVKCFIVIVISCIFLSVLGSFLLNHENGFNSNTYVSIFSQNINHTVNKSKTILIWIPFLSDNYANDFEKRIKPCKEKCTSTTNKSKETDADAVIFHLYDLFPRSVNWKIGTRTTIQFPTYRRPDQVWALFNMEPPCNMYWDTKVFNRIFNWTVWYRTDATIHWPYGSRYTLNHSEQILAVKKFKIRNFHAEKTKEIAGMISNCKDQGQRYKLVDKMQKYLAVNMYGGCYGNPCETAMAAENKSCHEILEQYKFYLAFENSVCIDYVTEKYWNALNRGQIPIVNWKKIHETMVIPNSYITVFDFESIKSFTDYIQKVSSNEALYNSYFQWKTRYKPGGPDTVCSLCNALHQQNFPNQVYTDLDGWVKKDICPKVGFFNHNINQILWWLYWKSGIDV